MSSKSWKVLGAVLTGGIIFALSAADIEPPEKYWNFAELAQPPVCHPSTFADSESPGLQAVLFDGYPVDGKAAPVFAYIGYPDTPVPAGGYPGVVLVHGGGGTAFPNYAKLWTRQGYAVIMPDWYNQRPLATPQIKKGKTIHSVPLEGRARNNIQVNVANLVLAHSLLRSLPKVNPEKTVFVGLSWGSWYGAIVTAVDSRFKGMIEIYCGDRRPELKSLIDGRFLHTAKTPMYWICSTNDKNVTPESLQRAFNECPTILNKTMVIKLPHSHGGFAFPSAFRMAAHFLKGEPPLPRLGKATVKHNTAMVKLLGQGKGVIKTVFCYTLDRDEPTAHKRIWKSIPAERKGNVLSIRLPEGIFQGFFSAYDEKSPYNDCCGSSDLLVF